MITKGEDNMAKFTKRQLEYLKDKEFLQKYLLLLNNRLVYSNNRIDHDEDGVNILHDNAHALSLEDNLNAFKILLNNIDTNNKLTEELITKVANTVNKHAMYISDNYRKIGNDVKFAGKYPIEKTYNIENKMHELLYNYYNDWSKLDIFEREALFNIEFLRIHPFEDGNGRTSRLILNYNMLKEGHAPILIPSDKRQEYFNARNKKDIKWIKELFETESQKELVVVDELIESYEKEKSTNKTRR
jgi:Fic family protein